MDNDDRNENAPRSDAVAKHARSDADDENALGPEKQRPVEESGTVRRQAGEKPRAAPETARRPVPGVKHEPEPDAGNIMPAEDEPGTL